MKGSGAWPFLLFILFVSPPVFGHAQEPSKIGVILSLSGPASFIGQAQRNAINIIEEEVNRKEELQSQRVKFIIHDDGGDKDKALVGIKRLIDQENVLAVIGPSLSPITFALIPVAEDKKVPLISLAAAVEIVRPVKPWVFKVPPSDSQAVEKLLEFLGAKNLRRVGLIYSGETFGLSGRDKFYEQAAGKGFELVAQEGYNPGDIDMREQIRKVVAAQADVLVVWGTLPGPALIARQMREMGAQLPLVNSHGAEPKKLMELGAAALSGSYLLTSPLLVVEQIPDADERQGALRKFRAEYEKRYGAADPFGGYAWDGARLVLNALKEAGLDRKKIRDYLEKVVNFQGPTGTFNFSPTDHNGLSKDAFVIVKIEGGNLKLVQ